MHQIAPKALDHVTGGFTRAQQTLGKSAVKFAQHKLHTSPVFLGDVTNSVKHAHAGPDDSINLELAIDDALIRCEVRDEGPGFDPPPASAEVSDRGWGLFFVEQIADRWGVDRDTSRVWFEIRRDRDDDTATQTAA